VVVGLLQNVCEELLQMLPVNNWLHKGSRESDLQLESVDQVDLQSTGSFIGIQPGAGDKSMKMRVRKAKGQ
jgi:hypothetical protein